MLPYKENSRLPSISINASFVVVEPASIPIKQSPSKSFSSRFFTVAFSCLCTNSLYSVSFSNNGSSGLVVVSCEFFKFSIFWVNSLFVNVSSFKESRAAPFATKR